MKTAQRKTGSRTNQPDIYERVTERICELLEQGVQPWKPSYFHHAAMPQNFLTGNEYRGINVFLLAILQFPTPYFLTYKQALELGGQVRRGEKGQFIVKYGTFNSEPKEGDEENNEKRGYLRSYTVFNSTQIDGIDFPAPPAIEEKGSAEIIESAEAIISAMPNPPKFEIGSSNQPCYVPALDAVKMPPRNFFETTEGFYKDLFHEITHATGHETRLNRDTLTAPVSIHSQGEAKKTYSKEELIAEMGAAFLSAESGITQDFEESASYLQGWLKVLKSKDNRKWIISAASQAQKAADYVLNR